MSFGSNAGLDLTGGLFPFLGFFSAPGLGERNTCGDPFVPKAESPFAPRLRGSPRLPCLACKRIAGVGVGVGVGGAEGERESIVSKTNGLFKVFL